MSTVLAPKTGFRPGPSSNNDSNDGNRGPGSGGPKGPGSADAYKLGMWLAIGAVTMLFAALTSAYVVRFGEAQATNEWGSFSLPRVLWLSSAVLIGSSVTFEFARRALKKDDTNAFSRWILVTTVLGIGFLAGQLAAWQQLRRQDIYVGSNPHSSFFFVLTGTHGLHLICGVFALLFVAMRRNKYSAKNRTAVEVTSIYWHFMDGLWIYLFLLLSFWR